MDYLSSDLQTAFMVLKAGVVPEMTSDDLASKILSAINNSLQSLSQSANSAGTTDSACLCLTLVIKIITAQSSKNASQDVRTFYEDVTRNLFKVSDLMTGLVNFLNCQDRILCHLTAKCFSAYVIYDLSTHGDINPVWTATLAKVFLNSAPGCTLDTCLWSLTEVIKGVLREESAHKQEVLKKLLVRFEAVLSSLYSKLLIQEKSEQLHPVKTFTGFSDLDITISTFMDLLEALTAARLKYGICSSVQRMMFQHTSALLCLMDSSSEYFVKKRMLLLLKQTLVQRPGDDWALDKGEGPSALQGDEFLTADMLSVADRVLQGVAAGWLRRVHVKPQPSFFGGNREFVDGEGNDAVMLRAVSLILIKSLHIKIQHAGGEGPDLAVCVRQYLLELLAFLQECVGQFKADAHSCCWIVSVFGDQDDDMMEAAKALTALYSYQRGFSCSGPETCISGCNPHCHFILLLQSLSFDHTVLLDFLISAETCFLEYFVLYLKLLRDNWQDFWNACCCIEGSEQMFGSSKKVTSIQPLISGSETCLEGTSGPSQPQFKTSDCSLPRLVDYGSSEEEEEEEGAVLNFQRIKNTKEQIEGTKSDDLVEKSRIDTTDCLVGKVVLCLSELRTIITKLHSKDLFPYNPTSLLKLLMVVETKTQLQDFSH